MNTKYNKITVLDETLDKLKKAPEIIQNIVIPEDIPHGDMPGDKVEIEEVHFSKAKTIFPLFHQFDLQFLIFFFLNLPFFFPLL